jgi:hypothetical protein
MLHKAAYFAIRIPGIDGKQRQFLQVARKSLEEARLFIPTEWIRLPLGVVWQQPDLGRS